ncbi:universal stress protein [Streptomyces sp. NPDC015220]|uniref:universal stress protein n=1 Tax=Streptomyces sp. NPDC015220 TaxID=3364947 RepID=UPI0036F96C42
MTLPLVVGADGSEASLEAVAWAAAEAVRHGVPLHVLHAAVGDHEASDVVRTAAERATAAAPAVRVSSEVVHEEAISSLVGKDRSALALVLGSRGLGGDLPGLLLGSVGLAVAARAHCPIIVVRGAAEHRDARFGSIVVGVEEGEGSDTAVEFAFREARTRHCRLVAVHAWNPRFGASPTPEVPPWYALEAHRRPPAQVLDDALRGPVERYGDTLTSRLVIDGPARQALVDAASEADLLIVGARRRQLVAGLQLGLINHALLHHAPCPVAVVPRT